MKQILLKTWLMVVCLLFGVGTSWAETATYRHVFTAKPNTGENITLSGVSWDITATNLNGYNSANYAGVQFGTSSKAGDISLTSSDTWSYGDKTCIKEIRLWLNQGGGTTTPSCTIGGKKATKSGTVTKNSSAGSDWSKASKITFTPATNGNEGVVVISVSATAAGYICALEIDTEDANGVSTPTITPSANTMGPRTVSLSAKTGTIYYTTDGSTPSNASTQYTASFTVTSTTTVKAIAYDNGNASSVSTQEIVVNPLASLPVSANEGKSNLGVGFAANGLGTDYSSAPKLKFDDTNDELLLGWDGEAKWMSFDIKGNSFSGGTFKVLTSADGNSYTELASFGELNGTETKEYALKSSDRFIKWVYTNKSSGNVALGNINVYNTNPVITLNAACTDGDYVYSTYSRLSAWVVPGDIEVSEVGVEDDALKVVSYNTGDIVPANTGVMVAALEGGDYTITLSNEAGAHPAGVTNALHPSSEPMTGNNLFYRLTMHNGTQIGFWWGAEGGAAFSLAANKAYLAVPNNSAGSNLRGLWFGGDETLTGIEAVETATDSAIYNLQGQRIQRLQQGVNIINGRKVIR